MVGYGFSGRRHVANIVENKGCRVRFIVEADASRRAQVITRHLFYAALAAPIPACVLVFGLFCLKT